VLGSATMADRKKDRLLGFRSPYFPELPSPKSDMASENNSKPLSSWTLMVHPDQSGSRKPLVFGGL
jgi:hypothetical protein